MNKNSSIFFVSLVVIILAGLLFFVAKPLANNMNLGLDLKGGLRVVLQAKEKNVSQDTLQKAVGILRERIDKMGVKENSLYTEGNDRVVVEITGTNDPEAALKTLGQTAQLEFWDEQGNVLVTGKHLTDAQAEADGSQGNGAFDVKISFDKEGTKLFADATQANVGKHISIRLDKKEISNPVVEVPINDGNAIIQGSFTAKEAQELAVLLRSGALPVSFIALENNTIGPTLGADSLHKSINAGIVGLVAVLIFMLGYYRLPGLVADISLILYGIVVLGVMALLHAVLTLPGIAGFVLGIGMAVDANVIIYERLKEELRLGKTLQASIESGYNRAFWTIFDSNLTTLITAFVLYFLGTGPIRGFAVTLTIGIIASMVIALYFTKWMLVMCSHITKEQKLYGI